MSVVGGEYKKHTHTNPTYKAKKKQIERTFLISDYYYSYFVYGTMTRTKPR